MRQRLLSLWKGNRSFIIFVVLLLTFRSVIADWNVVPTGSMKPTILEGDRILVN
ncbi:MAG: S26 family signal peptidase [Candidatus Thiodiazotropha endolucinida]